MSLLKVDITASLSSFDLAIKQSFPLNGISGLFGHSGAGKSTLLKAIAGIDKQASGVIQLGNKPLLDSSAKLNVPCRQRSIVGVFQHDALFPHLTVQENLLFGRKRLKNPKLKVDELITSAGLTQLLTRSVVSLSGGERQKVALVQAILAEPALLILDEPVTALDRQNKLNLLRLIKTLQHSTQMPMLFVSHNISEHEFLCDRLYVMKNGQITKHGNVASIVAQLASQQAIVPQTALTVNLAEHLTETESEHGLVQVSVANAATLNLYTLAERLTFINNQAHCSILASDISVCTSQPSNSSIVNQLAGDITDITISGHQALLSVNCQGQTFLSAISTHSLSQLALTIGQPVYLQFKASALQQLP